MWKVKVEVILIAFQDQGLTISSLQGDIIFGQRVNSAFGNLDAYGTNLMISAFDVRYFGINQNSDPDSLGWTEEKSILGHINKTFLLSDSFNIKLFMITIYIIQSFCHQSGWRH